MNTQQHKINIHSSKHSLIYLFNNFMKQKFFFIYILQERHAEMVRQNKAALAVQNEDNTTASSG